jgi:hypothetical protein
MQINVDGELPKEDKLKLENWMMHEFRRINVIVVGYMPREEKERNICCQGNQRCGQASGALAC